jgi:Domain of unknown function (DUF4340)
MKLRTLVITVALLAALSVVAYLRNRPEPAPAADPRVGKALLDAETVGRASGIAISDQGKKVELSRNADGTWLVASYYGMPADVDKISRLVRDLNESKIDRFVTSNPDRVARLDFKDSSIVLTDAAGREIWNLGFGKTPDSGNGRFVRFGKEPVAFFSGLHVWLDTDSKGWADARLVTAKPEEIAGIEIPLEGGPAVVVSRAKKDAAWTAAAPAGKRLAADKVPSLLTTLTSLRFSDTVDPKDPAVAEAAAHMRVFKLTTFDGKTLTIALGRKPEEKKPKAVEPPAKSPPAESPPAKAPPATPSPQATDAKPADAAAEAKPAAPEVETIPAGPVFATVSSSDAHAAVNDLMKRRAFEVDEYTFTGLPQKADDLFEPEKAK